VTGSFHRTAQKAGTVLVINSDPELLHILEVNLLHANLEVVSAQSGAEVLSKANAEKPDIIILDSILPDIDSTEVCQKLKDSPQTGHIPVIVIGTKNRGKGRAAKAVNGANHYVAKPFDPQEVVTVVLAYLKQKERAENVNPLTGLPNQIQVNRELTELIEQKKTFAAVYIALDDLRAFNRAYGFAQGDRTIRLLADIVCEAVRLFGNPDDLVGYLGADKFVVLTTPYRARSLCRRIIADFNRRIKALYTDEHLKRGYIAYESPRGVEEQSPLMSLRLAVVTNQKRTFYHHLEVSEAAADQMDYLRRFPGSNCYFDLPASDVEPALTATRKGTAYAHQEELKTMHGVLVWLDFIIRELSTPITGMKECLESLESVQIEKLTSEQWNGLKKIRENVDHLEQVMEGLAHLTWAEWLTATTSFEEIDVRDTLNWIVEQVSGLAEQRGIEVDIKGVKDIGQLRMDRRNLAQGLLYIVRSEVQSAPPQSKLHISATVISEDFINIEVINPDHHIPQRALAMLLQGQPEDAPHETLRNELYPAKLLVQGLGGKLTIASEREKGIVYTVTIPKRWQSWMQEVNALQLATEISRKKARAELKNIQSQLSSLDEQAPATMKDSLERLRSKVQELGVLCNRSLFLTDDLSSQLEIQQDRLLQQESEQLATTEALLNISREIARSMHAGQAFDSGSAKRVANYALTIANELRLSPIDRQALHHAALLKDLGLVLSPHDMLEQMVVSTLEEATAIRERFNQIWKALSMLPFLSLALVFILHRYERYDGGESLLGISGDNIPLGARILAVADTFDALTSGVSPQEALAPRLAVQKIVDDSGLRFDPEVVNAFLRAWKMKKLDLTPSPPQQADKIRQDETGRGASGG
jgi:diguanylate cyclase (GGDEF)-like protein